MTNRKNDTYAQIIAVEKLKAALPDILETQYIVAKIRKRSYDEHIKAGFTKDQALILCQKQ